MRRHYRPACKLQFVRAQPSGAISDQSFIELRIKTCRDRELLLIKNGKSVELQRNRSFLIRTVPSTHLDKGTRRAAPIVGEGRVMDRRDGSTNSDIILFYPSCDPVRKSKPFFCVVLSFFQGGIFVSCVRRFMDCVLQLQSKNRIGRL